jgi:hypothetical protein
MRFASEGIEPITEAAVDSLDANRTGFGNNFAQNGTELSGKEFSMLIPVLDGLRQAHHGRVLPAEDGPASPNEPADDTLVSGLLHSRATPRYTRSAHGLACDSEGHRSFDEVITDTSSGTGGDETAGAVLHKASLACAGIGFVRFPFFRTNDQNSSISTVEGCMQILCEDGCQGFLVLARTPQPFANCLILVPRNLFCARKLPRRITINSAWATSAAGVCGRYIVVPAVSPKKRSHPRQ